MLHVLSHPFEQMAACAGLIMNGVLERHPTLRVAFLESGSAWLPYWLDRMDGHVETWGKLVPAVRMKPSEYFRRQCFVSTDPEDGVVDAVVRHVGDECIVWASDYPHPDAHFPGSVEESLGKMAGIDDGSGRKIFTDNTARLYGIRTPPDSPVSSGLGWNSSRARAVAATGGTPRNISISSARSSR